MKEERIPEEELEGKYNRIKTHWKLHILYNNRRRFNK